MKYLKLTMLLLLFACQGNTKVAGDESKMNQVAEKVSNDPVIVEGAIGIIVESENYQFGDIIPVFDKNQNKISEIVITEETEVLALKCLSQDESAYEVLLEDGNVGYIPVSEQKVKFQTWQEHILNSLFAVGFNEKNNPLHEDPSEESKTIYYDQNEFYHPSQIKGEWLQVKWGSEGSWNYGWIRWREKEKLLIELFYFA
jgi:hypothetical protein